MNFSFESIVAKIDYTEWLTSEIRSACKIITGDEFPGEQAMGQRAKELAALIQKKRSLAFSCTLFASEWKSKC